MKIQKAEAGRIELSRDRFEWVVTVEGGDPQCPGEIATDITEREAKYSQGY